MTWSYSVIKEPGMRSCAWMVLVSGGTVVSSREATSQVGVVIRLNSASVISGTLLPRKGATTPQIGTEAANRSR